MGEKRVSDGLLHDGEYYAPDTRGKPNVEETEATMPMIENAKAMVSNSYNIQVIVSIESNTDNGRYMTTHRKFAPELGLVSQVGKKVIVSLA